MLTHLVCFEEDQKQNWELISVWVIMKGLFFVTLADFVPCSFC